MIAVITLATVFALQVSDQIVVDSCPNEHVVSPPMHCMTRECAACPAETYCLLGYTPAKLGPCHIKCLRVKTTCQANFLSS